ncbi:MAG: membrane protein insertion efficiency factor YidD [Porticoccus sp.]|nr:membrane protein insertion efficiency factor YidD [Porticoccus sp.]
MINRLTKILFISLIKFYRYFLSPWLGDNCKYHPTCSSYAVDAIQTYGVFKGGYMTCCRLVRCHPFKSGGYDPVPPPIKKQRKK